MANEKSARAEDCAVLALPLLLEGNSIRSTERITKLDRNTIMGLLVRAGERCEKLLADRITSLKVRNVESDEMWGYIGMKEKAKGNLYKNVDTLGDAYTYVAIERNSKLILAWHLGKRSKQDTLAFIQKLRRAIEGKFQLTTDGWPSYPDAVEVVSGPGQSPLCGAFQRSLHIARTSNVDRWMLA